MPPTSPQPRPPRIIAPTAVACALMLACFAITAVTAVDRKNATVDEPRHLAAAWLQNHFADFRWDADNPPLWKYYFAAGAYPPALHIPLDSAGRPVLRESDYGKLSFDDLYTTPGLNPDAVIAAARHRMIFLGIALGAIIAFWSWRWGGSVAAVVATAAFCFDPNFLAHAALVKNDVPIALCFTAMMFALWLLGERATFPRWLAVSLFLAAALTTKFSGVLALPILALALLVRAVLPAPWPILKFTAHSFPKKISAALILGVASLLVSWLGIWAAYGFRYETSPDPAQPFNTDVALKMYASQMAAYEHNAPPDVSGPQVLLWTQQWQPDLTFRLCQWSLAHHPLPQGWILGFLSTYGLAHSRNAFLCGQISQIGWWYYFPLAFVFKTPLATLAAVVLAAVYFLRTRRRDTAQKNLWPLIAATLAPAIYTVVSIQSHLDLGLRHILPVYCFLYIFLGIAAARAWARRPKPTAFLCSLLILGLAIETYAAYPDFIPFFNAAAGGSRGGLRLLSDSNLDWGQDLTTLRDWQKRHPDRTVCLYYFGSADPHYYGIKYCLAGYGHDTPFPSRQQMAKLNVVIAISATELQGTYLTGSQDIKFRDEMRNAQPTEVLGGSIYLYDLK